MIGAFVSLIVTLLIVGVLYWAAMQLLSIFPLPAPFGRAVTVLLQVLAVLIVLAAVLQVFGLYDAGLPALRHYR